MHMDFDAAFMARHGHGRYTRLGTGLLPPLYLAWNANAAGDSGKVAPVGTLLSPSCIALLLPSFISHVLFKKG